MDETFLGEVAEIFTQQIMYFLHCGVGVALLHPMVQHGFQIDGGDVAYDFVPNQREHLVLGGAFQPVVGGALYRGELENLEPMGEAVLYSLLRFVRVTHLGVELSDVGGDLLLGLCFRFAGEHFPFFLPVFVKVPDHTLPATIRPPKYIAVGGQSLFRHLAAPFLNHQHYRIATAYVHP